MPPRRALSLGRALFLSSARFLGMLRNGCVLGAVLLVVSGCAFGGEDASTRCPEGLHASAARCCAVGQEFGGGACHGVASRCPVSMQLSDGVCRAAERAVPIPGGTPGTAPADWQPQASAAASLRAVAAFLIDRTEVSEARWATCVAAGRCAERRFVEDTLPVRAVSPEDARSFCEFAGGDLPTHAQWLLAAAGRAGRRFPWGMTGLVCRRAAFGLVQGPCAKNADGPEALGSRPDGATPEGVFDLAGNVAEWTVEANGSFAARGGSYMSQNPAELKSWALEERSTAATHVGVRCAYPEPKD